MVVFTFSVYPLIDNCPLVTPCAREKPQAPFPQAELSRESVEKIRLIDKGNFGEVWLGRIQSVEVAIKIPLGTACHEDFIREAKKMHSICHPQLVQFLGVCTKPESAETYIITEYMSKGALNKYLKSIEGKRLKELDLFSIMDQVK